MLQDVYAQANILSHKFSMCTDGVKMCLFRAYCTPLNTAQRRSNYKEASFQRLQAGHKDAMSILLKRLRCQYSSSQSINVL